MELRGADVGEDVDRALRSAGLPVARTLAVVAGQGTAQAPLLLALPSEIPRLIVTLPQCTTST